MGKLTIVGFFSRKKVFLVNLLYSRIMYGGNRVMENFLRKLSLYVLYSFSVCPLNFSRTLNSETWGIMFSKCSSLNSGGGGSSTVRYKNGDSSTFQLYSPFASISLFLFSSVISVGRIFFVQILISPWNDLKTTLESLFFVPFNAICRALRNHERKVRASPCWVIWNFFLEHKTTACSISCGETWAWKAERLKFSWSKSS